MENYKYTNKLLKALAICNLWAFIPGIWGTWWEFEFAFGVVGDNTLLTSTILASIQVYAILIFTTWAFLFRRWYWVVIFYVMYLSYSMPMTVMALIEYWNKSASINDLESFLSIYTDIFTWLLGIITIITMLSETPYRHLFKRWHNKLQKIKANFSISHS